MPGDSRRARSELSGYGRKPPEQRAATLTQLAATEGVGGVRTATRVALEDPSPLVAWTVVNALAGDPTLQAEIAKRDAASLPRAFRHAKLLSDLRKPTKYPLDPVVRQQLNQALADMRDAAIYTGLVPYELQDKLRTDALWRGDHAQALAVLRSMNVGVSEDFTRVIRRPAADAVAAYHAAHGPFPGLASDLRAADPVVAAATLARVADRAGTPLLATVCWRAVDTGFEPLEPSEQAISRIYLYAWLRGAGDYRAAVRILTPIDQLTLPPNVGLQANTLTMRHDIAMMADDDALAIEMLERIQQAGPVFQRGRNIWTGDDVDAELTWRRWRIERDRSGAVVDEQLLTRIRDFATNDLNCAIDVIPWLDAHGRGEEAQAVFDSYFGRLKAALPENENAEALNNIAWFCSRARRNLEEAAAWQRKALAMEPTKNEYIDTMADIEAGLGRFTEAARLEELALRLQPGMPFFEKQLFRFRARAAAQK
jgi:tetratricopeptide (TPR) repeat protein